MYIVLHAYLYRSDESTKWQQLRGEKKKTTTAGWKRREGGKHAIALRNSMREPTNLMQQERKQENGACLVTATTTFGFHHVENAVNRGSTLSTNAVTLLMGKLALASSSFNQADGPLVNIPHTSATVGRSCAACGR